MFWKLINGIRHAKFSYDTFVERPGVHRVFWWNGGKNFGDALNPLIADYLGAKTVEWVPHTCNVEHYQLVGSVLQKSNKHTIVWGSGFIDAHLNPYDAPKEILAVRGPMTRRRLLDLGIKCPEVYGDPALLMPCFYRPSVSKEYEIGIIPHYSDKSTTFIQRQRHDPRVKVIDVEQENCEAFIRDVLSCKRIASSSLHGLIIADAYEIPSVWITLRSRSVFGDGFKFDDYFRSVGRATIRPISIGDAQHNLDVLTLPCQYSASYDPTKMLDSRPF